MGNVRACRQNAFLLLNFKIDEERVWLNLCNRVVVVFFICKKAGVGGIKFTKKKKEEPGGPGCSKWSISNFL